MDEETVIRERAYAIWEREGRPEGRHGEHWEQACRELSAEATVGGATPDTNPPGPDAGVQNPPSASEQHLREAAGRLHGADREPAERTWVSEG
ncbi:MAG TPA: DUF2934 domain-containing protein [Azospirillum sp.]